jgi:hypothetical protein
MRTVGPIGFHLLCGALGFWVPDILLHATDGVSFWRSTIIPTFCFFVVYRIGKAILKERSDASGPIYMIVGVWLFASTAMMVGATFYGGGFFMGFTDSFAAIALGLIPPYTLIMSAYDGSVAGLLLTSSLAIGVHFIFEPNHWVLPPSMRNRLKQWYSHRLARNF